MLDTIYLSCTEYNWLFTSSAHQKSAVGLAAALAGACAVVQRNERGGKEGKCSQAGRAGAQWAFGKRRGGGGVGLFALMLPCPAAALVTMAITTFLPQAQRLTCMLSILRPKDKSKVTSCGSTERSAPSQLSFHLTIQYSADLNLLRLRFFSNAQAQCMASSRIPNRWSSAYNRGIPTSDHFRDSARLPLN